MANCDFSGESAHVSDFNVLNRKAKCPHCSRKLKITIPNKDHGNLAKFPIHKAEHKHGPDCKHGDE